MKRSLLAIALILTFASSARADESSTAAAQALFKEGRKFIQEGQYAMACDRLTRSDKLDPAVGTRLSLGECFEGLHLTASAWAAYNDAFALATQRNDASRADVAKKRADALEPKLARLTIRVTTGTPDLFVARNGTHVDPAAFETALPIDAGHHWITATAPGRRPFETTVDIADRQAKEIRIPVLEADGSAVAANASTTPSSQPTNDSRNTLALGLEIGGGVAIVGGLVIGGLAMSKWSSVEDTCPDGHCRTNADRDRLEPEVSTARTLATVSTVTLGLGVVALGAGIVLHVTAPSQRVGVALLPVLDPRSPGLAAAARF